MIRALIIIASLVLAFPSFATEAGWALLRNGGQVVILNHANAPGSGEPASFDIESCRTQRNLSDQGRQQARRIGALFAARSAPVQEVLASRYCRTRETADLVFGSSAVETVEWLDPVEPNSPDEESYRELLYETVEGYTGQGILVLVTHDSFIETVVGTRVRAGEALIVQATEDGLQVAGRIVF